MRATNLPLRTVKVGKSSNRAVEQGYVARAISRSPLTHLPSELPCSATKANNKPRRPEAAPHTAARSVPASTTTKTFPPHGRKPAESQLSGSPLS